MLSRRDLLRRGAALTGSAAAGGLWRRPRATSAGPGPTFDHGVASGDPTAAAVVLWTRVGGVLGDVAVRWVLARDEALLDVVRSGEAATGADRDHTVHVDVGGLDPATTWWYRFDVGGAASPTGRTRTAPAPDDARDVRLGVVSCSSFAAGPFDAYRHLAAADVDLVVHLGDYLYEAGRGPRRHEPEDDPVTLADYRRRHAQQRSDPDLRHLHARLPMAAVWDDHDVAGNAWRHGAANHDPDLQGPWEVRRAAALQAWLEWLPVRLPDPARPDRIWRRLRLGATADLLLLDTRHDGRDRQLRSGGQDRGGAGPRAMVSDDQRRWLGAALAEAGPAWRVLGNQVVLAPLAFAVPDLLAGFADGLGTTVDGRVVNPDAWDGYPEAREDLLRAIAAGGPTVVLTGDVHSSWALEVPDGSGTTVAVEWVAPSVSAPPFVDVVGLPGPLAAAALDRLGRQLPHLRWAELTRHGFVVVALEAERAQADWWHVGRDGTAAVAASWAVDRSAPTLVEADPLPDRPAPTAPPATVAPTTTAATGGSDPSDPVPPVALAGLGAMAVGAVGLAIGLRRRRR